ncbi:hypothetical protein [Cryobacterium sp. PAMC25264]|uniref:hypothetical protein n=1 Tax=Cryobacterium sp. PAMC25264 TaxID=2861288 RepID=UPI001C6357EC|nr:hypothetical protein [Cryobacterium sp. PAMC25264]QYF74007.1 hypothetical protein KY500_01745 [Cryobacterium sp. PAMC25264]
MDYFAYMEQIGDVNEFAGKEVARIRAQTEAYTADRRRSADAAIAQMVAAGAACAEVAGRLGIATRDVKRAAPTPASPAKTGAGNAAPGEHRTEQESTPVGQ